MASHEPEPTVEELPQLMRRLRTSSLNENASRAVSRIEYILEGIGLLPRAPERPSERAMRLAKVRRQKEKAVVDKLAYGDNK